MPSGMTGLLFLDQELAIRTASKPDLYDLLIINMLDIPTHNHTALVLIYNINY